MASKNTPVAIISGAGWLMQLALGLVKGLLSRGWDNERIHALVTDKGKTDMERVIDALVNALVAPLAPAIDLATGICRFTIDFGKSLEEMIAAGKYDWRNNEITAARFPITGGGTVMVDGKLFHFNRNTTTDEVERELDKAGYRAATIAELLAFGASFPEVQRQFPVIALGSVGLVGGDRRVPYLHGHDAGRSLGLRWRDGVGWDDACRFLAVRLPAQAGK